VADGSVYSMAVLAAAECWSAHGDLS
jgi:hypothetical protein